MKGFKALAIYFLLCTTFCFGNSQQYLKGKINKTDKRYKTFLKALELCEERQAQVLVETGTARDGDTNFEGDGGSTPIFGAFAKDHAATLYTVDIDSEALTQARRATQAVADAIEFVHSDSIEFLESFEDPIDFLYLDSYDYKKNNPRLCRLSQMHHLAEIQAAFPNLHEGSIVMIDDCDLPYGGKGKYVIEFLENQGWRVLTKGYQVIMVFEK